MRSQLRILRPPCISDGQIWTQVYERKTGLTAAFDPYDDGYDRCDGLFAMYIKSTKGRESMLKRKTQKTVLVENEREEVKTI